MFPSPYRKLMHFKRWSTDGLNAVIGANLERFGDRDRALVLQVLDHVQTVDEIFRANLEGRDHERSAPRSDTLPAFDDLRHRAQSIGAWYADYVDGLAPEAYDEPIDFIFSNGSPARMTRGEMILHVALHGAGHRGNIGAILHLNGIAPNPDRITDFVAAAAD